MTIGCGTVLLTRDSGMDAGQHGHPNHKHEEAMQHAYQRAAPPVRDAPGLEHKNVQEGKYQAIHQVGNETVEASSISIGGKHCPEHVGHVHPRETQRL